MRPHPHTDEAERKQLKLNLLDGALCEKEIDFLSMMESMIPLHKKTAAGSAGQDFSPTLGG